jgi:cytochrome b561
MKMHAATGDRYDRVQIILHWLIAAIIIFMIGLGLFMVGLPKESELPPGQESVRAFYFLLHKSMGITAAILIAIRVIWRLTHQAPALPDYIPNWQQKASKGVHGLLYVLMIAMPVSGYLQSIFSPYDTKFWGIVLPRMAEADKDMKHLFHEVHEVLAFALIALIVIHLAAVVKHKLVGNDIDKRMSLLK